MSVPMSVSKSVPVPVLMSVSMPVTRARSMASGSPGAPLGSIGYSAAAACAFSIRAAQNLNSGILPNGSSTGLVRRFAAASA